MGYRPLADRLIVRIVEPAEAVTAGGIVLPGQAGQDKFTKQGTVEAVGAKVEEVSVGDVVMFSGFSGNPFPDDNELRLMREGEIMAVVEG